MEVDMKTNNSHDKKIAQFNFDLDKMKKAVSAQSHVMPDNLTDEEYLEWIKNIQTQTKKPIQM